MSDAVLEIVSRINTFSPQERAELAYAFLQSLDDEDEGVAEAWEAELSRRAAEIRSGRAVGKAADQLFAELEGESS